MNKDLHNIDDLFKNSIDGHEEEVPPEVWKNIDHSLDKKQAAFYKRKYFTVRAAAIFLILIGGITIAAILHFNRNKPLQDNPNSSSVASSETKNKSKAVDNTTPKDEKVEVIIGKKPNEQAGAGINNNKANQQGNDPGNNNISSIKNNSKKYETINNNSYSATKNQDIAITKHRLGKNLLTHKPHFKGPDNLIADLYIPPQQKIAQENGVTIPEARGKLHIHSVNAGLLSANRIDGATVFSTIRVNNLLTSLASEPSSITKKSRVKTSVKGWSILPFYAQNINLNTLKDDDHFHDPRNNSMEAKITEQEITSFTIGLGIQKQISKNIYLQTGAQYFISETNIQPKIIYAVPDNNGSANYRFGCSSGYSYFGTKMGPPPSVGDSIRTNLSKSTLSYLQVPLLVSYKINLGRFSFRPSAGILSNFLLRGNLTSALEHPGGDEEVTSTIDGLKPVYFSGILQPQLNYKLNERFSLMLNPNFNFSLSPINKETAVKTYHNMISLGAGIQIKL